jgi:cell division initiation protein
MLTPLELSKKAFKTTLVGGYDKEDVNNFIKSVRSDYEELYKSVIDMREEINRLNSELERYRSTSEQLQKALTLAQKTADDIKLAADRQADLVIMQANIKAEQIKNEAKEKLKLLSDHYTQFSSEFSAYLETFMKLLKKLDDKFDAITSLNIEEKGLESSQLNEPGSQEEEQD